MHYTKKATLKQKNAPLLMVIHRHATWLNISQRQICRRVLCQSLGALAQSRKAAIIFFISVRQSVYLSVCPSVCLSVCLSVRQSVYLSVCPSACLCTRMYQPDSHWTDLHHSLRARLSQSCWWTFKSSRMLCRPVYGYRLFQAAQI